MKRGFSPDLEECKPPVRVFQQFILLRLKHVVKHRRFFTIDEWLPKSVSWAVDSLPSTEALDTTGGKKKTTNVDKGPESQLLEPDEHNRNHCRSDARWKTEEKIRARLETEETSSYYSIAINIKFEWARSWRI